MSAGELAVAHEAALRAGTFALVLTLVAVAERRWPVRGDARPARRQLVNAALAAGNGALLRLVVPLLAVGLAVDVAARGGGLFGWVAWPTWLEVVLTLLVFDATIYWQHRLLHRVGFLWPIHRVHHTDLRFDVTTGVRFHPVEIVLSMAVKLGLVVILGPDPAAVLLFEIVLAAGSLFTHGDVALPRGAEWVVRLAIVTPSMHRIHHSVRREETDSNYGFNLALWDRVFGSYRARPAEPESTMPIGVPSWRDPEALGLLALLQQPFRRVPRSADSCENEGGDA